MACNLATCLDAAPQMPYSLYTSYKKCSVPSTWNCTWPLSIWNIASSGHYELKIAFTSTREREVKVCSGMVSLMIVKMTVFTVVKKNKMHVFEQPITLWWLANTDVWLSLKNHLRGALPLERVLLLLKPFKMYFQWPISQIPQCIRHISHNAAFCNRNVYISVTKWCYWGIWDWCIVGFIQV